MDSVVVSFISLFACAFLVLFFCLYRSFKKKQVVASKVRLLLCVTMLAVIIQSVLLFTLDAKTALILHTLYLVCICGIRYAALKIAIEVTRHDMTHVSIFYFVDAIIGLDALLVLSNIFTQSLFTVQKVKIANWYYYTTKSQSLNTLHNIVSCGILMLIAFIIIYKMVGLSFVYSSKYIVLLAAVVVAVAVSFSYKLLNYAVDISVLGYTIAVVAAYLTLLENKQKMLIDKMLSSIVSQTDDIIVFFDIEGDCIFLNDRAKRFFGVKDNYSIVSKQINKMFHLEDFDSDRLEYSTLCSMSNKGEVKHYDILYKKLYRNGKLEGSYYKIKDRTIDVDIFNKDKYKATHDKLTGLYNSDYFCDKVEEILKENPDTDYCILCSDVKDFKLINDSFGKAVGDKVLNSIAWKLREKIPKDTLYCRLSGDKFCIFTKKEKYDEELFRSIAKEVSLSDGIHYPINMQIGVYDIEDRKLSPSMMIDRAGMAISENKEDYQNKVFYYDDKIRELKYWEQRLSGELDKAVMDNQLKIYLQAQCNSKGKVIGAEALIRWVHPTEGLMPPYRFIPMFEKNGLISKVDLFVWEEAAKLLKKWKDEGRGDYYISVNISPADFYFLDIYKELVKIVERYDINPARLKLEITETLIMKDVESRLMIVEKLRDYGFTVEMDDFGSGYSSLNMLKDISVDVLKLDMGFLYKTKDEEKSRKIIGMIVQLSKALDMPVICEGVETQSQFEFLRNIKCDYFQGYLFAKPVSVKEFEEIHM